MIGKIVLTLALSLMLGDCHHARGNAVPTAPAAPAGGWVCAGWVAPPLAGPPAICHPIDIGNARSLPWGGWGKFDVDNSYARNDLERLVDDTIGILISSDDTFVHMETIRRSVIYMTGIGHSETSKSSAWAAKTLDDLVTELKSRLTTAMFEQAGEAGAKELMALRSFDIGYLQAAFRQASHVGDQGGGEQYLAHAIELQPENGAMRLGAALAMYGHGTADKACFEHLGAAIALADDASGNLHANLMGTFGHFLGTDTHAELARKVHEHLKRL